MLSRGQVSKQFDIPESTLCFYEKEDLVVPSRVEGDSNGCRAYSDGDTDAQMQKMMIN